MNILDIPEVRTISDYMSHLNVRRVALGGLVEEDVLEQFSAVSGMFCECIDRIVSENEELRGQVGELTELLSQNGGLGNPGTEWYESSRAVVSDIERASAAVLEQKQENEQLTRRLVAAIEAVTNGFGAAAATPAPAPPSPAPYVPGLRTYVPKSGKY
ncbi:MAG: hypothetical protein LBO63_06210 [Oscillospiraceae bacterium]|jgi:hypothetical protein|nr:hypothetical protein [Oscillospiraceae bacterium]